VGVVSFGVKNGSTNAFLASPTTAAGFSTTIFSAQLLVGIQLVGEFCSTGRVF